MDFPIALQENFVSSTEEFRQVITLLFKESVGNFLQSPSLGALFSLHTDDATSLQLALERTLEQVPGAELVDMQVYSDKVFMKVSYRGKIQDFQFEVETKE